MNFKEAFEKVDQNRKFMSAMTIGRDKIKIEELLDKDLHLCDFSLLTSASGDFSLLLFKEFPNAFAYGGKVITTRLKEISELCGSEDEARKSVQEDPPKVVLSRVRSAKTDENGFYRYYTTMTIKE